MPVRFRILRSATSSGGASLGPSPQGPLPDGPSEERTFEIAEDVDEIRIGRQPGVAIELPFPAVSSVHARLYTSDLPTAWWAEDLGSMNGTWVDGLRLEPRRPVALRAGQRLRIASVDLVFEGWSKNPRGAESTASIARRLISDLFGVVGGEVPTLSAEPGTASPPTLPLAVRDRPYLAGRFEGCDLVLSGDNVSREHAAFVRRWDGVAVSDLGSRNGVQVNGHPIAAGEARLADGDVVDVGGVEVRLSDPEDRYLRRLHDLGANPAPGRSTAGEPAAGTYTPGAMGARGVRPTPLVGAPAPPAAASASAARPVAPASPTRSPARAVLPPRTVAIAVAIAVLAAAVAGLIALFVVT